MTDESGDVRETGEGPSAAFPPPTYPRAPPDEAKDKIFYGQTFKDDSFQYRLPVGSFLLVKATKTRNFTPFRRYIVLPEEYKLKLDDFSDHHLMTYSELRDLGVVLQPGWQHCLFWRPPRRKFFHTAEFRAMSLWESRKPLGQIKREIQD
jgi:Cyclin-dependent kinase regulatory subunit